MKKALLSFLLLAIVIAPAFSQQEAQTSMYLFNGLYNNPAYAGSRDALNATVMYRNQWVKIPGAPQTASIAANSPLPNPKLALGVIYSFDQVGVTKTNSLNIDFAYRLKVGKKKDITLSFGISAGFQNYQADLNSVATTDLNDP